MHAVIGSGTVLVLDILPQYSQRDDQTCESRNRDNPVFYDLK